MGEDGRGWERMGEDGRGWERMGEDGRGWERMGEDGRGENKVGLKYNSPACSVPWCNDRRGVDPLTKTKLVSSSRVLGSFVDSRLRRESVRRLSCPCLSLLQTKS